MSLDSSLVLLIRVRVLEEEVLSLVSRNCIVFPGLITLDESGTSSLQKSHHEDS